MNRKAAEPILLRNARFNVALDDSLPQVYGARRVPGRPLTVFACIDQYVLFASGAQPLVLADIDFLNSAFGAVHQRQETRIVNLWCGHIMRSIRAPARANFSSIFS